MNPNNFDAYSKRGSLLNYLGRYEEALINFNTAIKINSDFEEAFLSRGNLFYDLKKYREAIDDYDRAIFINPEYAEAHSNRGNALNEISKYDDALVSLNKSIELNSDNEIAYYNRGVVLRNLNLYNAALVDYSKAIDIKYDYPEAHWNKSLVLLLTQKLEEGWSLYKEWRWKIKIEFSKKLDTNIPYWNMQNTNSQSKILFWAEQGIGDEIFYFGMLKNFADIEARVTVSADTRLHALFSRSMPEVEFIDKKEIVNVCNEDTFDFQAPIGDIGLLCSVDKSLEQKASKPFLQINQSKCIEIKNKNPFLSGKFVCGISWKSNNKDIGIAKSLNLIDLSPLLSIENVVFVSLQYGSTADEIEFVEKKIGIKIHTIGDLDIFNDIDGLVSLISLCNLVVTTSNITSHLTGAIGKKGMVLIPFSKGKIWYWHSGVGPSLWYPSLELVSQSQMNDWTDPINKCKEWVLGQL
jgi:Flp pilus assembly protein TadD